MKAFIITHKRSLHFANVSRNDSPALNLILQIFRRILGEDSVSLTVHSDDEYLSLPFHISWLHHLFHQIIFSLLKLIWSLKTLFHHLLKDSAPLDCSLHAGLIALSEIRSIAGDLYKNLLRSRSDYLMYYKRLLNIEAAHLNCIKTALNREDAVLLICEDDLQLKKYYFNLDKVFSQILTKHIRCFGDSKPYLLFLSDSYLPALYDENKWSKVNGLIYKRTNFFRDSPTFFNQQSTDCMNCYLINSTAARMLTSRIEYCNRSLLLALLPIDWKINYLFLINKLAIHIGKVSPTPFLQGSLLA